MQKHSNSTSGSGTAVPTSDANRRILLLTGLSAASALVLASLYPPPLLLAVFSSLLLLMAMATGFTAIMLAHRPLAEHLNFWDKAALLTFAGLAIGMFVDAEAVRTFLEAQPQGGADTASAAPGAEKP